MHAATRNRSLSELTAAADRASAGEGYLYQSLSVREAVRYATNGSWDVPEFQRDFVWRRGQVCALADSLLRGYPIGFLLLWADQSRTGTIDDVLWIADGEQRMTALCLLFGELPIWWRKRGGEHRSDLPENGGVYFDAENDREPFLYLPAPPDLSQSRDRLVEVKNLLALDPAEPSTLVEARRLAREIHHACRSENLSEDKICGRLLAVCAIPARSLLTVVVNHALPEVLEIFQRLNSRGMRFRQILLRMAMKAVPGIRRLQQGAETSR